MIVKERDKLRVSVRVWVSRLPVTVRAPKETCVHSIWSSTRSVCSFTTDGGGRGSTYHNPLPRNNTITHTFHSEPSHYFWCLVKNRKLSRAIGILLS